MNMRTITAHKKVALIAAIALVISGGAFAALSQPSAHATDVPPIVTEVDQHDQELKNHEARITNAENDISDLQNNTNTAPSTSHVAVPSTASTGSSQPAGSTSTTSTATTTPDTTPAPTPTPDPRTVTAVSDTPRSGGLHTCRYTLYDAKANAKQAPVIQQDTAPCYQVGDVLPIG